MDRLQSGYVSIAEAEADGTLKFWDESFEPYGDECFWWEGFNDYDDYSWLQAQMFKGEIYFTRLRNVYTDATLWGDDDEITFADVQQGNAPGYLKATMSSFAEYPDLVR